MMSYKQQPANIAAFMPTKAVVACRLWKAYRSTDAQLPIELVQIGRRSSCHHILRRMGGVQKRVCVNKLADDAHDGIQSNRFVVKLPTSSPYKMYLLSLAARAAPLPGLTKTSTPLAFTRHLANSRHRPCAVTNTCNHAWITAFLC